MQYTELYYYNYNKEPAKTPILIIKAPTFIPYMHTIKDRKGSVKSLGGSWSDQYRGVGSTWRAYPKIRGSFVLRSSPDLSASEG